MTPIDWSTSWPRCRKGNDKCRCLNPGAAGVRVHDPWRTLARPARRASGQASPGQASLLHWRALASLGEPLESPGEPLASLLWRASGEPPASLCRPLASLGEPIAASPPSPPALTGEPWLTGRGSPASLGEPEDHGEPFEHLIRDPNSGERDGADRVHADGGRADARRRRGRKRACAADAARRRGDDGDELRRVRVALLKGLAWRQNDGRWRLAPLRRQLEPVRHEEEVGAEGGHLGDQLVVVCVRADEHADAAELCPRHTRAAPLRAQ
eukprot:gene7128-biopygen3252